MPSFSLPLLSSGDRVALIAPASRCSEDRLMALVNLLSSWDLEVVVDPSLFGEDLLCANTDAARFAHLEQTLYDPTIRAMICVRGGYGSMRLLPALSKLSLPSARKLLVGMSDITSLHLYFQQAWRWPTLHASLTQEECDNESIAAVRAVLFGAVKTVDWFGRALNAAARQDTVLQSTMIGGNLTLVQASLGTVGQIDARGKCLFLEEVGERGYRVDRMLMHLQQAGCFDGVAAVILGDFLKGEEPNGASIIQPVLERFAREIAVPVIQISGVGHGKTNGPMPLGTSVRVQLGQTPVVEVSC